MFLYILMAALLLQPAAYPYAISEYAVTINISEGKVHERIDITLDNYGYLEIFEYSFLYSLENLQVYDSRGEIDHEIRNDLLLCHVNLVGNQEYRFTIEFDTSGYISPVKEGKWVFSPIFQFSVPVQNFSIEITVPADMAVVSPIYPTPTSFYSYRESLVVKWKKETLEEGEEFLVLLGYKPVTSPPSEQTLIYYIFAAAFLAFISGLYLGRRRNPKPEYVVADEKIVLDAIRKMGGEVIQSDLVKEIGFSKAKVSKILSELEERRVIRKEKYKRTNRVFLNE
jgi:hypothetical protein